MSGKHDAGVDTRGSNDSLTRATHKFSALEPEGAHAQRAPVEIDRNA